MQFRVLGAVELWSHDRRIDLGPAKTQLLLAVLLLEAGHIVPFDTLVDRVWGDAAPAKVAGTVQANLSRLRRRLEEAGDTRVTLHHVPGVGYRLTVPGECVDALEFTRLISQGQAVANSGEHERAIGLLRTAEAMVYGEPLAGLPGSWAQAARAGLQERHHAATLTRIALQLEGEDPHALIGELRELAGRHPLDETVAGLLMRALHDAGRSADALREYTVIRHRLREELGMDPHNPLREIHTLVLRGGEDRAPAVHTMPAVSESHVAPDTLERDLPGFVGRHEDLAMLQQEIATLLDSDQSVLCLIDGMPGVGKSTLALHLAHALRARCPDGALQLHLRGHDQHQPPTAPDTALDLLLAMLGVEARRVQHAASLDHAITLWRHHTSGRRLLLVLDDAADVEQIRPLIPGGAGSLVLVTSRHHLADLPSAIHHTLPLMRSGDAHALFTSAAKATVADSDAETLRGIIEACGRLPLALSIAGGYLRMHPSWTITDLAERLTRSLSSQESDTLSARLNAAFETSYRDLPQLPCRVLRRLALHPGTRIGLGAAAALADVDAAQAESALELLVEHHLLAEPQRRSYRLHDLVRNFAGHALARDDPLSEQQAAEQRLAHFTLSTVEHATIRFHPHRHLNLAARSGHPPNTNGLEFADARHAAVWLDTEQGTLRALAEYWHSHARPEQAASLAHMLAPYFDRRSLWKESIPLHENALHTWVQRNDSLGQACVLTDLSMARWRLGAFDQARFYAETALNLWRQLGDKAGQADALLQLGRAHQYTHQPAAAIGHYRRSAGLRGAAGDEHGQAVSLYHLGTALFDHGEYDEGISHTQKALELARRARDDAVERNCLNNLGEIFKYRAEYDKARNSYERALEIASRIGDIHNIAVAVLNLGEIYILIRRPDTALPLLDSALKTFRKLGSQNNEITTLVAQCRAYQQLDQSTRSDLALHQAGVLAEQLADPLALAIVGLASGFVHKQRGDLVAASRALTHTLALARRANAPLEQAAAHHALGDCLHASGDESAAHEHWRQALTLYAPLHSDEVRKLQVKLEGDAAGT